MAISRLSKSFISSNSIVRGKPKFKDFSAGLEALVSGGTITEIDGYTVHTFTSSASFEILWSKGDLNIEYLVIAGGGSGGGGNGGQGGGGAGGYRTNVPGQVSGRGAAAEGPMSLSRGSYLAAVGAGGGNSTFSSITSTRGGNGAGRSGTGGSGGAGGGGGSSNPVGFSGGSGTAGQGYNGGKGGPDAGWDGWGGSGGGAAGTPTGRSSNITGTTVTRAGGGAPQRFTSVGCSSGHNSGGGGNRCVSGLVNSGGGGGASASGGSGIIIVRYAS